MHHSGTIRKNSCGKANEKWEKVPKKKRAIKDTWNVRSRPCYWWTSGLVRTCVLVIWFFPPSNRLEHIWLLWAANRIRSWCVFFSSVRVYADFHTARKRKRFHWLKTRSKHMRSTDRRKSSQMKEEKSFDVQTPALISHTKCVLVTTAIPPMIISILSRV